MIRKRGRCVIRVRGRVPCGCGQRPRLETSKLERGSSYERMGWAFAGAISGWCSCGVCLGISKNYSELDA